MEPQSEEGADTAPPRVLRRWSRRDGAPLPARGFPCKAPPAGPQRFRHGAGERPPSPASTPRCSVLTRHFQSCWRKRSPRPVTCPGAGPLQSCSHPRSPSRNHGCGEFRVLRRQGNDDALILRGQAQGIHKARTIPSGVFSHPARTLCLDAKLAASCFTLAKRTALMSRRDRACGTGESGRAGRNPIRAPPANAGRQKNYVNVPYRSLDSCPKPGVSEKNAPMLGKCQRQNPSPRSTAGYFGQLPQSSLFSRCLP